MIWEEPGEGTVLKLYRNADSFAELRYRATGYRVQREWSALGQLAERGVACTVPVHWFHGHSSHWGYCQGLRTRAIVGATELNSQITEGHLDVGDIELRPLYRLVSSMH